jgi:hypothetical protein
MAASGGLAREYIRGGKGFVIISKIVLFYKLKLIKCSQQLKRTRCLQETNRMRFEEAYNGWRKRRFTKDEAALLLGVSDCIFHRYIDRYEERGLERITEIPLQEGVDLGAGFFGNFLYFHGEDP